MNPKLEYVKCIICDIDDTRTILTGIVKCRKCGLIYRNPRIIEDEIVKYYQETLTVEDIKDVWSTSKPSLFQKGLKLINSAVTDKERILDIGCGHGLFLKMVKESGFKEVIGIELSKNACEFVHKELGLTVHNKALRKVQFPDNYFDCITLWSVMELLGRPDRELEEVYRILKPGGMIFVRGYNSDFHMFFMKMGKILRRFGFSPAVLHRYGLNEKTYRKLLNKCGFICIKVHNSRTTSGDPYKTSKYLGEWFVRLVKFSLYVLSEIVRVISMNKLLIGSALTVYAKKPSKIRKILEIITRLDMGGSSEVVLTICKNSDKQKYESILVCGYGEKADKLGRLRRLTFPFSFNFCYNYIIWNTFLA